MSNENPTRLDLQKPYPDIRYVISEGAPAKISTVLDPDDFNKPLPQPTKDFLVSIFKLALIGYHEVKFVVSETNLVFKLSKGSFKIVDIDDNDIVLYHAQKDSTLTFVVSELFEYIEDPKGYRNYITKIFPEEEGLFNEYVYTLVNQLSTESSKEGK